MQGHHILVNLECDIHLKTNVLISLINPYYGCQNMVEFLPFSDCLLSDFKLQVSHTAMLSKEHITCCWKHGIINQLIRVVSREP